MNDLTLVERMGELLEVDLDTVFSLKNVDGEYQIILFLEKNCFVN